MTSAVGGETRVATWVELAVDVAEVARLAIATTTSEAVGGVVGAAVGVHPTLRELAAIAERHNADRYYTSRPISDMFVET